MVETKVNPNIRVQPRVCKRCFDFIYTPISEQICVFKDIRHNDFIEVCNKNCKGK